MEKRSLTQSDIARMSGVSRQAVSLWFKSDNDFIDLMVSNFSKLCGALNISSEELLTPIPGLTQTGRFETMFNWDHQFKDVTSFFLALVQGNQRAIGRLVQVYGMYRSAAVLGNRIWREFPGYSRFIHPSKRKICEKIIQLRENPIRI